MQHIFTNIPHEKNNNFCVYVCVCAFKHFKLVKLKNIVI